MDMNYVKFFNKYLFSLLSSTIYRFWSMNTIENHLECIWLNKSISHFSSTKKEVSQRYLFSYYETRKKSILVNIELYNVDEQIKNHFY